MLELTLSTTRHISNQNSIGKIIFWCRLKVKCTNCRAVHNSPESVVLESSGLAEDSRTTDCQLGLWVFIGIMISSRQM